jgi:hypothetical protein
MKSNTDSIEKTYVDKKLELSDLKDQIRKQQLQHHKRASRALWLTMSRLLRSSEKQQLQTHFCKLILPRSSMRA